MLKIKFCDYCKSNTTNLTCSYLINSFSKKFKVQNFNHSFILLIKSIVNL